MDLAPVTPFEAVGLLGVALYLFAYGGVQVGRIDGNGLAYSMLNAAAASCILISMIEAFNLAGTLVNLLFLMISLVGATRIARAHLAWRRRLRREEEAARLTAEPELAARGLAKRRAGLAPGRRATSSLRGGNGRSG